MNPCHVRRGSTLDNWTRREVPTHAITGSMCTEDAQVAVRQGSSSVKLVCLVHMQVWIRNNPETKFAYSLHVIDEIPI